MNIIYIEVNTGAPFVSRFNAHGELRVGNEKDTPADVIIEIR